MQDLVVDSSVVVKWFFDEVHASDARRILEGYGKGNVTLHAPDLLYAEVGNILWKKQRFQGVTPEDARQVLTTFQALPFTITRTSVLLGDAYRLAVTHQRTVYDALYLALSLQRQCPFVTADEKLVNAVKPALPFIQHVRDRA